MKKNILRFAISAVAVIAVMAVCVSTYKSLSPTTDQTAAVLLDNSQATPQEETAEIEAFGATVVESQTTTTTTEATAAQTTSTTVQTTKTTKTTKNKSDSTTTTAKKTTTKTTTSTTAATTTTTTVSTTQQTTTTTASMSSGEYAAAMFEKVNSYRKSNGRSSLKRVTSGALYEAAKIRLNEIMSSYSHTRPDGSKSSTVYAEVGLYPGCCAENLAYGSMDNVYNGWIGSSGHRTNILNGNYTQTALVSGYANGRRYWVQLFIG